MQVSVSHTAFKTRQSIATIVSPVPHRKTSFFWPLRLIAVFSVLAPAILFAWSIWQNLRAIDNQANERIERAIDVLHEHTLKALQTVERAISETNEVLRGLSDDEIRAREADFFLRFKRTQQALPQIEAIWAFDRSGRPIVSSTIFPVPANLNNSDRSYFRAHVNADIGTYISEVLRARIGSLRFFVVSARRAGDAAGHFNGVIGVTVMPEHFSEFYRKLSRGSDSFALVRVDGSLLARYPDASASVQSGAPINFQDAIAKNPENGFFLSTSPIDGLERRYGYRKVSDFPVYVATGIETAELTRQFRDIVAVQLALGLPVVAAMFALALYGLRRAQHFQTETLRREAAETALKQSQRMEAIGQLTGGVAHDFNNLLMVISGNIDRLKRTLSLDERQGRAVDAIESAVKRGTSLTRQLLSYSRRQTHEARTIDLRERLPTLREMLQSSLRGNISVQIRMPADLWPVRVDVSEFELALLNLAVNGRDAMPSGGELIIEAKNLAAEKSGALGLSGDYVVVSVTDTGTGIPPETLSRVFEPFFTTKQVGKGTGLGLSQVYGFARQAGGTATIKSEVGAGTIVNLYLPRSLDPVDPPPEAPLPVTGTLTPQGRVLVVEDNREVAEITGNLLQRLGYAIRYAGDAPGALALLASNEKFDLVITDIVMPGMSGLDLARRIRREKGPGLPVMLVTGYSDDGQTAADEGFTILRKPFDSLQLEAAVRTVQAGAAS